MNQISFWQIFYDRVPSHTVQRSSIVASPKGHVLHVALGDVLRESRCVADLGVHRPPQPLLIAVVERALDPDLVRPAEGVGDHGAGLPCELLLVDLALLELPQEPGQVVEVLLLGDGEGAGKALGLQERLALGAGCFEDAIEGEQQAPQLGRAHQPGGLHDLGLLEPELGQGVHLVNPPGREWIRRSVFHPSGCFQSDRASVQTWSSSSWVLFLDEEVYLLHLCFSVSFPSNPVAHLKKIFHPDLLDDLPRSSPPILLRLLLPRSS